MLPDIFPITLPKKNGAVTLPPAVIVSTVAIVLDCTNPLINNVEFAGVKTKLGLAPKSPKLLN